MWCLAVWKISKNVSGKLSASIYWTKQPVLGPSIPIGPVTVPASFLLSMFHHLSPFGKFICPVPRYVATNLLHYIVSHPRRPWLLEYSILATRHKPAVTEFQKDRLIVNFECNYDEVLSFRCTVHSRFQYKPINFKMYLPHIIARNSNILAYNRTYSLSELPNFVKIIGIGFMTLSSDW
jgi:hypothetical protein